MKVFGYCKSKDWRCFRVICGSRIALEVTSAWTDPYSDTEFAKHTNSRKEIL